MAVTSTGARNIVSGQDLIVGDVVVPFKGPAIAEDIVLREGQS